MISFRFDKYTIELSDGMASNLIDSDYANGIVIEHDGNVYELIHNIDANWNRILINYKDGSWKDLPMNEGTFGFLPDGVKVIIDEQY